MAHTVPVYIPDADYIDRQLGITEPADEETENVYTTTDSSTVATCYDPWDHSACTHQAFETITTDAPGRVGTVDGAARDDGGPS